MDLSNPKLRKILVGVAIFVVVVFIVIRFFRRSNYSYPNTTEQNEYTITSIAATTPATTPASVTVTTSAAGIKAGELVFLYGLTGGTLSGTKQVQATNIPPGVTAPAGAIAVYVLAAPAPTATTFAVEGTVSVAITGGKVQTIGYQPMSAMTSTNTQCQNQYAFDLLDNTITPKVFTPTGTPQTLSSSSKQLNLATAMTFAKDDRVTVVGANDSTGSPAFLMVDAPSTGTTVTFTAASITALAGGSATILPQSPVANVTKAYNTRQACISASAMTYTLSHCKYLPPADGSRPLIPTADTDPAAASAYTAYTTAMNTIQAQYAPALTRAQNGQLFPQGGTLNGATLSTQQKVDIVTAARKADLAGATRKYLASVCPGFYAPGDPTLPDPTGTYTKWSIKTGASPAPSTFTDPTFWYATAATTSGTGGISDADIMAWAKYAGVVTYSGGVSGVTVTTGGSGYVNGSTVSFSGGGGKDAAGTAVVTNGALTGVTITAPGTGYTSAPAAVFTAGTGAVTTISLVQTLNASGPFISTGSFGTTTYTATDYSKKDSAGEENWRKAYYSGAGTYPKPSYAS